MSIKQKILLVVFSILAVNIAFVVVLVLVPAGDTKKVFDGQPTGSESEYGGGSVQIISRASSSDSSKALEAEVPLSPSTEAPVKSVGGLTIPHTVGEVDRVEVPVYTEGTVFDAMRAYEETGAFTFHEKEFVGLGFFVEEVQGVSPPRGQYWILYLNGEKASVGVSHAYVRPGDMIEWRIEKGM
jgi:hypothetical protein